MSVQKLKRSLVDLQDHFKSSIFNSKFLVRIISAKKKIKKIVLEKKFLKNSNKKRLKKLRRKFLVKQEEKFYFRIFLRKKFSKL